VSPESRLGNDKNQLVSVFTRRGLNLKSRAAEGALIERIRQTGADEYSTLSRRAERNYHCIMQLSSATPDDKLAHIFVSAPFSHVRASEPPISPVRGCGIEPSGADNGKSPQSKIRESSPSNQLTGGNITQTAPDSSIDPIGEYWVCVKEVLGTDFGWWQSDGSIFFRHKVCWRCEKCQVVIELNDSQKADTRMFNFTHALCEKGSGADKCFLCSADVSQLAPNSVEWSTVGFYCPACTKSDTPVAASHKRKMERRDDEDDGPKGPKKPKIDPADLEAVENGVYIPRYPPQPNDDIKLEQIGDE
jgi:hypothetical protein